MTDSTENDCDILNDVVYADRPTGELMADLYLPKTDSVPRPAVIWLFGGGWRFGNRKQAPDLCRYYAARGITMVAIEYRLSGDAIFPAAIEDVKAAIRWLKTVSEDYNIDPDRIGLWGSSAGGHLATLATTSDDTHFNDGLRGGVSASVAAVVAGYPPCDFLQLDAHRDPEGKPSDDPESIQLPPDMRSAAPDSLESLFLGAPIETVPEVVETANPITYIGDDLPPFLIVHGLSDTAVPDHQSRILYDAIAKTGCDVTLALFEKLGHGFFSRKGLDEKPYDATIYRNGQSENTIGREHIMEFVGGWFETHL